MATASNWTLGVRATNRFEIKTSVSCESVEQIVNVFLAKIEETDRREKQINVELTKEEASELVTRLQKAIAAL